MAQNNAAELDKFLRGLIKTFGVWMREKAHGQIVITFRDGVIQLISENRQRKPQDYIE